MPERALTSCDSLSFSLCPLWVAPLARVALGAGVLAALIDLWERSTLLSFFLSSFVFTVCFVFLFVHE